MTILSFVIALGLLVFIHEFGHFLWAKKQGIGVEKFSLGFGPKLVGFRRGETTYLISAIPLGGYVKLKGEEADSAEASDPRSYAGRPVSQRFRVVFAGPMMNLLLAAVLMPIVFMLGKMEPAYLGERPVVTDVRRDSPAEKAGLRKGDEILKIDGEACPHWKELLNEILIRADSEVTLEVRRGGEIVSPSVRIGHEESSKGGVLGIEPYFFIGNEAVVDQIGPGSAAEEAGLKVGDQVLEIDGHAVEDWTRMSDLVQASGGKRLAIWVRRGVERLRVSVTPRFDPGMKRWLLGVQKDLEKRAPPMVKHRYRFTEAVIRGTEENGRLARMTLSVLGRLVTFRLSYKTLGGPIRIAQVAGAAARSSLSDFLFFLSFLSLQLGILNFLPIPVLDGGHLFFLSFEQIFRRPVSPKVRSVVEQAGFYLLLTLMVLITINDVDSLWGIGYLWDKIRAIW